MKRTAIMNKFKLFAQAIMMLAAVFVFALPSVTIAAEGSKIGMVLSVRGEVFAKQKAAELRRLQRRSSVLLHDTIVSKEKSWAQVRLEDGTLLSISPNTEFFIEAFKYDKKATKKDQFIGKLVKGTLVGLSGQGKAKDYKLKGPVSAIVMRGTGVVFKVADNKENVGLFDGEVTVQSKCPAGTDPRVCRQRIKVLRNPKGKDYQTIEVKSTGAIDPYKGALIEPMPLGSEEFHKMKKDSIERLEAIYRMLIPGK